MDEVVLASDSDDSCVFVDHVAVDEKFDDSSVFYHEENTKEINKTSAYSYPITPNDEIHKDEKTSILGEDSVYCIDESRDTSSDGDHESSHNRESEQPSCEDELENSVSEVESDFDEKPERLQESDDSKQTRNMSYFIRHKVTSSSKSYCDAQSDVNPRNFSDDKSYDVDHVSENFSENRASVCCIDESHNHESEQSSCKDELENSVSEAESDFDEQPKDLLESDDSNKTGNKSNFIRHKVTSSSESNCDAQSDVNPRDFSDDKSYDGDHVSENFSENHVSVCCIDESHNVESEQPSCEDELENSVSEAESDFDGKPERLQESDDSKKTGNKSNFIRHKVVTSSSESDCDAQTFSDDKSYDGDHDASENFNENHASVCCTDESERSKRLQESDDSNKSNVVRHKITFSSESDSDEHFEQFLSKMKTTTKKKVQHRLPWDDDFINDVSSSSDDEGHRIDVRQKLFPSKSTPVRSTIGKVKLLDISPESNAPTLLTPEPDAPVFSTPENSSTDDIFSSQVSSLPKINRTSEKTKSQSCDFLSSLSPSIPNAKKCPSALPYFKNFKSKKEELARKIFDIFNEQVFKQQLPQETVISWNVRLTKSAGLCVCKRSLSAVNGRTATIELSSKVIDSAYRLRDTLLHEMCHAATWVIYGFQDGHGKFWKFWAQEAVRVFPKIPMPTVCHSYEINTKYSYKCELCGACVGRHSKSLDTERKRCGRCGGKFELKTPLRTPSKFALFVKENYGSVKKSNQKSKHGDIMRILSADFSSKAKISDA